MPVRFSAALVVFLVLAFFSALSFGLAWWASTGEFWAVSSPEEREIAPSSEQAAAGAERGADTASTSAQK